MSNISKVLTDERIREIVSRAAAPAAPEATQEKVPEGATFTSLDEPGAMIFGESNSMDTKMNNTQLPRFYMGHGVWHDRVTGQHLWTQDQYDQQWRTMYKAGFADAATGYNMLTSEMSEVTTVRGAKTVGPTSVASDSPVRRALTLAMAICDAVPSRAHESPEGDPLRSIGMLVNYQEATGAHGYAVIRDALEALDRDADAAGWLPTVEAVNALPEGIRKYVQQLEAEVERTTHRSASGATAAADLTVEQQLRSELDGAFAERDKWEEAFNKAMEQVVTAAPAAQPDELLERYRALEQEWNALMGALACEDTTSAVNVIESLKAAATTTSQPDEAVLRFGIEVEKLLCAASGRKWSASGISIESLINELKVARQPDEARDAALEEAALIAESHSYGPCGEYDYSYGNAEAKADDRADQIAVAIRYAKRNPTAASPSHPDPEQK